MFLKNKKSKTIITNKQQRIQILTLFKYFVSNQIKFFFTMINKLNLIE